jgi:hypothetical protein
MSGPVSKSAPRGVAPNFAWPLLRHASLASPKQRFTPSGKTLIIKKGHVRVMAAIFEPLMAASPKTPRRPRFIFLSNFSSDDYTVFVAARVF